MGRLPRFGQQGTHGVGIRWSRDDRRAKDKLARPRTVRSFPSSFHAPTDVLTLPSTTPLDPSLDNPPPHTSFFIYLVLSGLTYVVARALYSSFAAPSRSAPTVKRTRAPKTVAPAFTVTESTYDEDWIPKDVLKAVKGKGKKGKKGDTSATSGEESEGTKKRK